MNKLKISLKAINSNYTLLKNKLGGAECAAVVKANAYGLGVKPIAESLFNHGCNTFFVALLEEGLQLRSVLPDATIYVLHGVMSEAEAHHFEHHNLIPVLNNKDQLSFWPKTSPAAVHFDTGMTRLGFARHEVGLLSQNNIKLVISHLACADTQKSPHNYNQLIEFEEICKIFPTPPKSFCNSYGIWLGREFHYNLARPGIALYGGNPNPAEANVMNPVVTLTSQIIQINRIIGKRSVGYGATYTAKEGDVIATVPCGYADGLLRTLGNHSKVYIGSNAFDVVGRVSMDLITVKINNLPQYLQKIGTEVQIIGANNTICDVAKAAGTIEYEVITRLGNRFKRVYE